MQTWLRKNFMDDKKKKVLLSQILRHIYSDYKHNMSNNLDLKNFSRFFKKNKVDKLKYNVTISLLLQ